MSHSPDPLSSVNLNLLLFSLAGVCFGVDVAQIREMSTYDGKEAEDLFWFHQELGMEGKELIYDAPTVLVIRTGDARKYRVIIDTPADLVDIRIDEIWPFPRIMAPFVMQKGMWGVALRGERKILIVDFLFLLRRRSAIKEHDREGRNE